MFKNKRREVKLESLQVQLDFMDALRSRHLGWVNDTDDAEIVRLHIEIIALLQQLQDHYRRLLALYHKAHE